MPFRASFVDPTVEYATGSTPQSDFPVPFPFDDMRDLQVTVNGVEVPFAMVGGVAEEGFFRDASVRLLTPASLARVAIERRTLPDQSIVFPTSGAFPVRVLNREFSRAWMACQDLLTRFARVLRTPAGDGPLTAIPDRTTRANRVLGFDGIGNPVALDLTGGGGGGTGTGTGEVLPPIKIPEDALSEYLQERIKLLDLIDPLKIVPGSVWDALLANEDALLLLRRDFAALGTIEYEPLPTAPVDTPAPYVDPRTGELIIGQNKLAAAVQVLSTEGSDLARFVQTLVVADTNIRSSIVTLQEVTAAEARSIRQLVVANSSPTGPTGESAGVLELQRVTATTAEDVRQLFARDSTRQAAIEVLSRVDQTQGATYAIKTDVNGLVIGFGVLNTGDANTSAVRFKADRFIIEGSGGSRVTPFAVIDGVTYIDNARIRQLTWGNLQPGASTDVTNAGWWRGHGVRSAPNQEWQRILAVGMNFPTGGGTMHATASLCVDFWPGLPENYRVHLWVGGGAPGPNIYDNEPSGANTGLALSGEHSFCLTASSWVAAGHQVAALWMMSGYRGVQDGGGPAPVQGNMNVIGRWR